ncbi:MAG: helix-turn-helix domain-containing protein [Bryobacteraceae bacterium]
MKSLVEPKRQSDPRDTVELLLTAVADAIADRLEHRQEARRRLLDMDATCEYLGVSEDGVYRLVAEGKLTPVSLDRRKRFDIRELDKLIEEAKGHRG